MPWETTFCFGVPYISGSKGKLWEYLWEYVIYIYIYLFFWGGGGGYGAEFGISVSGGFKNMLFFYMG